SAETRIRSVSWLLAAKCFTEAPTPADWMPRTRPAPRNPESTGSSEKYSKLRPPKGERLMFIPGPRTTATPCAAASVPMAWPTRAMSSGSNVAARPTAGGKQVAGRELSSAGCPPLPASLRTPCGPSVSRICPSPSRSMALVRQVSAPLVNAAFSARVRSLGVRGGIDRSLSGTSAHGLDRDHGEGAEQGQHDCGGEEPGVPDGEDNGTGHGGGECLRQRDGHGHDAQVVAEGLRIGERLGHQHRVHRLEHAVAQGADAVGDHHPGDCGGGERGHHGAGEQDRGDTDENLATPEVVRERSGEDGRQYTPRGTDQGQQRNGGSCLFSAQFDVVRKDVQQVA